MKKIITLIVVMVAFLTLTCVTVTATAASADTINLVVGQSIPWQFTYGGELKVSGANSAVGAKLTRSGEKYSLMIEAKAVGNATLKISDATSGNGLQTFPVKVSAPKVETREENLTIVRGESQNLSFSYNGDKLKSSVSKGGVIKSAVSQKNGTVKISVTALKAGETKLLLKNKYGSTVFKLTLTVTVPDVKTEVIDLCVGESSSFDFATSEKLTKAVSGTSAEVEVEKTNKGYAVKLYAVEKGTTDITFKDGNKNAILKVTINVLGYADTFTFRTGSSIEFDTTTASRKTRLQCANSNVTVSAKKGTIYKVTVDNPGIYTLVYTSSQGNTSYYRLNAYDEVSLMSGETYLYSFGYKGEPDVTGSSSKITADLKKVDSNSYQIFFTAKSEGEATYKVVGEEGDLFEIRVYSSIKSSTLNVETGIFDIPALRGYDRISSSDNSICRITSDGYEFLRRGTCKLNAYNSAGLLIYCVDVTVS